MRFNSYHVLEKLLQSRTSKNLSDYYIIGVQHLLYTTGSLFESLIAYGFIPHQIYLTGKIYSTHLDTKDTLSSIGLNIIESTYNIELGMYIQSLESDIQKMWQDLIQNIRPNSKIIILDDGGYTLKNTPQAIIDSHPIYGIEQTTSGIRMQSVFGKFPVIHLASSAAKVILEPKIVSDSVMLQLGKIIEEIAPEKIGIVGYGHIGNAIVKDLKKKYLIYVFDIKNEMSKDIYQDVTYCTSLVELINYSDILIGATGQDISSITWLENIHKNITLISVSSGDIEFKTLIKNCKSYLEHEVSSPLDTLAIRTKNNSKITILRGGMVANFTGSYESGPSLGIQLTRGLIFSSIIQIIENQSLLSGRYGAIMLSPSLQREVVNYWFNDQPQKKLDYSAQIIKSFNRTNWIKSLSGGEFIC